MSVEPHENDTIAGVGLRVTACAIGQAAAVIFAQDSAGRNIKGLSRVRDQIKDWLSGGKALPDWNGIEQLSEAKHFPGRHEAILLPWSAAIEALSNDQSAS